MPSGKIFWLTGIYLVMHKDASNTNGCQVNLSGNGLTFILGRLGSEGLATQVSQYKYFPFNEPIPVLSSSSIVATSGANVRVECIIFGYTERI